MRLKSIKIAGFKSFVDPTTIPFPDNLTAIVGPNGCGKSNTIDAVRWVMGESSAKNLRGESMADVIFNGSNTRKPTTQASVELVFDNSDGTVGGEYARYAEISVKRLATRDGQSSYYLNNIKCRRKDITDIFLGTGLGPRSYAIIEQGMISRLIEAKPEELRIYIEEAAGISKYKERRKETEHRMQRTRENLERLEDIREELGRQLSHLERQAQAAEKYRQYREEERLLRAQLQAMRWRRVDVEVTAKETLIRDREVVLEACIADQRKADADIETHRDEHTGISDRLNAVQGRFYGLGAEIARLEQTLQHTRERSQQWRRDLQEAVAQCRQIEQQTDSDQAQLQETAGELLALEPENELLAAREEDAQAAFLEAEERMQRWQNDWDSFTQRASEPVQRAQIEQSRIQHLEQSIERLRDRLGRLQREQETLSAGPLEIEVAELEARVADADEQQDARQVRLQQIQEAIRQRRDANARVGNELDQLKAELNTLRGRVASLDALQQASLGDNAQVQWLERHGYTHARRLAQQLQVVPGWEKAVETVLGHHLQALCVDSLDALAGQVGEFDQGAVTLLSQEGSLPAPAADSLAARVSGHTGVASLLAGVSTAPDIAAAFARRASLGIMESVVTPEGIWLGRNWVRLQREEQTGQGVLARQKALEESRERLETVEIAVEERADALQTARDQLREDEESRDELQREMSAFNRSLIDLKAQMSAKQVRLEQFTARRDRIQREMDECSAQQATESEQIRVARATWQEAMDMIGSDTDRREALQKDRDSLRMALDGARQRAREARDESHRMALEVRSLRARETSLKQALERSRLQLQGLNDKRGQLEELLSEGDEPVLELHEQLESKLAQRVEIEAQLGAVRRELETCEHSLRGAERRRQEAERTAQDVRNDLERHRIQWQGLQVERKNLLAQLEEAQFDIQEVLPGLDEAATEEAWTTELERIGQRISRLGAINLAAIDEYKTQSERKVYLDSQHADLSSALETLENAIRKIDKETRTRFQETFEKVNKGLQALFPKVFGGGHAYLELTGDDLLDTGVAIMARPPGKKNSTIHLLSGGEKALTAIALVFSIFQLNPAPFCMLDEVDAPLDDANVGRYSRMVQEMSDKVQFIYITHNKIAMEMAHQLMGVTMHEPGVSRLVSVDVEEAAALAAL
jgi:chromosome segregation protein